MLCVLSDRCLLAGTKIFFCGGYIDATQDDSMMHRPKRVVNRNLAATSTVRLIEALKPPEPDQHPNIILKPKETKKRLPGTALLIKMAKQQEKEKAKKEAQREAKRPEPEIDEEAVERALADVLADLML